MKPLFKSDLNEILEASRQDLLALKGARIFVTGGTGFFGKWIVETLMHARELLLGGDLEVTVLTRNPAQARKVFEGAFDLGQIKWHSGEITSFAYPKGQFTHLIHAATPARTTINDNAPTTMLDITVLGTKRALEFAKASGVGRFLLTSSGAVYGPQPPDVYGLTEDLKGFLDPMDPKNAYAIGKLTAEHYCRQYSSAELQCLIARCFAFVGPGLPLDEHFAIGNFIGDALAGRPIVIKGDGTPYRSYLYPTDLMSQLLAILIRGESCRPYNVGHEKAWSIRETAEAVGRIAQVDVKILGQPMPGARAARYVPKTDRLKDLRLSQPLELIPSIERSLKWNQHSDDQNV
ncbi:MAG: NAD-dependent epimerase/dehydratase family protein [Oligoflexia bacterium]